MIPKIIHQTWKNKNIPKKWSSYHKTWKDIFPESEFEHILWTDEDNRNLIKNHYSWFLKTYDNYPKNIQRADAIRYFILYHHGGIYADLDCEVRENFYEDLTHDTINLADNPYGPGSKMNNLMASNKGNEKWKIVFDELEKRKNILATTKSTGPCVLDCLENDKIRLLDIDNYNPLKKRPWWRHHIENTFFLTLDEKYSRNWDKAKVVHHGTESWAWEEIKHEIKNNILLVFFIILVILVLVYYFKLNKNHTD